MAYLIGADEAGYGPNLGPLVISATVWRVPEEALTCDLYERLAGCVRATATREDSQNRVAMADSKLLYKPGQGLSLLEAGVLAALRVLGRDVNCWQDLWAALSAMGEGFSSQPWHVDVNPPLPCANPVAMIHDLANGLDRGLRASKVELHTMQATAIFPNHFNDLIEQHGSKGSLLSYNTLELVRELLAPLEEPVLVVCDKHGGRNHYAPLLQHFFPDHFVETRGEGRASSIYRFGPKDRRVEIQFVAKGERFLPSALASMTSKYLREQAMAVFNDYWRHRKPGLRATAGYPVDAARFRAEIAGAQQTAGIPDRMLWRNR